MASLVEFLPPPTTGTEIIGGFGFDQAERPSRVSPKEFN